MHQAPFWIFCTYIPNMATKVKSNHDLLETKCLFCGSKAEKYSKNGDSDPGNIDTIINIFSISRSHVAAKVLNLSKYCKTCQELVTDATFTISLIEKLQGKIKDYKDRVYLLIQNNLASLQGSSNPITIEESKYKVGVQNILECK